MLSLLSILVLFFFLCVCRSKIVYIIIKAKKNCKLNVLVYDTGHLPPLLVALGDGVARLLVALSDGVARLLVAIIVMVLPDFLSPLVMVLPDFLSTLVMAFLDLPDFLSFFHVFLYLNFSLSI